MAKKYTPEQIDKILQKLPEELKEAVFSMETADAIWKACERQKLIDERMTKIAERAGYVLMGLMLPQEFERMLQKEMKLSKRMAEELTREINRFVFYPVKPALEALYNMEISGPEGMEKPKVKIGLRVDEESEGPRGMDAYRESIE